MESFAETERQPGTGRISIVSDEAEGDAENDSASDMIGGPVAPVALVELRRAALEVARHA